MHDAIADQMSHIQQHLAMCKQKLRGLRGSRNNKKQQDGDNFILFPYCQYPFLEDEKRQCKMVKTVINCDISNSKLQKLMRINHPNIINIQKIAKGHRTMLLNTSNDVFYSFYFETVPYSLKKIVTASNSNKPLIFQLVSLNLAKILRNVNSFLMKEGIYNIFKLQDIGITNEAQLKVYISPLIVIGGLSLKMGNHKAVMASIDKLVGWWQTSLASHEAIHPSNNKILMQIPEDFASEESIEDNFRETIERGKTFGKAKISSKNMSPKMRFSSKQAGYNKIRASTYSSQGQKFVTSSVEIGKSMNINEQIKFIRQKLRETRMRNSQSDKTIPQESKIAGKNGNININAINRAQQASKAYEKANNITFKVNDCTNPESVQHINSINITTNPVQVRQVKKLVIEAPKKTSIQMQCISPNYEIRPKQSQKCRIQRTSLDTYQMEFNHSDIDVCEKPKNNNEHDLEERELSWHNFKAKQGNYKFEPQRSNQVSKNNIHQSAGQLQLQKFVHQSLKPQYKPKNCDIKDKSGQKQSQQSKPLSRNIKNNSIGLFEVRNKAQKADSHRDLLVQPSMPQAKIQVEEKLHHRTSDGKLNAILHKSRQINLQYTSEVRIGPIKGSKVKNVLSKTKEAIALLNKAKTAPNFQLKLTPC